MQAQHQAQLQAQVLRVADKRFAPVPLDVRKRIRTASPAILNKWHEELLDATSLGEVFGDERANEGADAGELVPPPHTASTNRNGTIHPMARAVLMVTELRFGPVNAGLRQHIVTANDAALVDWLDRLAVAQDLEAVFGAGQVSREENAGSEAA